MIIFLQLLFYQVVAASEKENRNHETVCNNFVVINGSSNVNQFKFVNHNLQISFPRNRSGNGASFPRIMIPVHHFSGSNSRMLNDFYKMVDASNYPVITIDIDPSEPFLLNKANSTSTTLKTKISIAGESRSYLVSCDVFNCPQSGIVLKGEIKIALTDFNIDPPVKVLGAVKVNNQVFINFAFQLDSEEFLTEMVTK